MISYEDFAKIELKVGKVLSADRVEGSEKLLRLKVDLAEENPRQILAGVGRTYDPEMLVGKEIVIVANLEPRKLMGEESQGMLLAASDGEGNLALICPDKEIKEGSGIK